MGFYYDKIKGYDPLTTLLKRPTKINWVVTPRDNEFIDEVIKHTYKLSQMQSKVDKKSREGLKEIFIYDTVAGLESIIRLKADFKLLTGSGTTQVMNPEKAYRTFLSDKGDYSTLIIRDAEKLRDGSFWRLVINSIPQLSDTAKCVLFLSPFESYPLEYQRFINVFYHKLPSLEERLNFVKQTKDYLMKKFNLITFSDDYIEKIAKITSGLTLLEIRNAIVRSIIIEKGDQTRSIIPDIDTIILHKEEIMEKTAKIKFLHNKTSLDDLGGLGQLKKYVKNRFKKPELPKSGIILVGVPGTGKTTFGESLGNYLNLPSAYLNFSSIFNRLVGDSEKSMKAAIDILETIGDSILIIDEVEKIFGGVQSSNKSDGGTTNRVFELFLRWLNKKDRKVYVIATSNNIDELPPEFIRAGRWDNIFWIDYPNEMEAKEIFIKKCNAYKVKNPEDMYKFVDLKEMTGAEIEQLVIEYCYSNDWTEAMKFVPKIYNTQKEKISKIRKQLGQKYISAAEENLNLQNETITGTSSIDDEGNIVIN